MIYSTGYEKKIEIIMAYITRKLSNSIIQTQLIMSTPESNKTVSNMSFYEEKLETAVRIGDLETAKAIVLNKEITTPTQVAVITYMMNKTKNYFIALPDPVKLSASFIGFLLERKLWDYDDEVYFSKKYTYFHGQEKMIDMGHVLDSIDKLREAYDIQKITINSTPISKPITGKKFSKRVIKWSAKSETEKLENFLINNSFIEITSKNIIEIIPAVYSAEFLNKSLTIYDLILAVLTVDILKTFNEKQASELLRKYHNFYLVQKLLLLLMQNDVISPNLLDGTGCPLLYYACLNGDMNIVMELSKNDKLDYNYRTGKFIPSVYIATKNKHNNIVKYLVSNKKVDPYKDHGIERNSLQYAASVGNLEIVKYLVEEIKMPVNLENSTSKGTPLHGAASSGQLECLKYLISVDKSGLDKKNSHGYAPLHSSLEHLVCVKYLIEEVKVDPMMPGPDNQNILEISISKDYTDTLNYILDNDLIDPYIVTNGKMIFDTAPGNSILDFYKSHHKNYVNVNKNTIIKLVNGNTITFPGDNMLLCIHDNIEFSSNGMIIKSINYNPKLKTDTYLRLASGTHVLVGGSIESVLHDTTYIRLVNGMSVTLPKGKKVMINDIPVTLENDLDASIVHLSK